MSKHSLKSLVMTEAMASSLRQKKQKENELNFITKVQNLIDSPASLLRDEKANLVLISFVQHTVPARPALHVPVAKICLVGNTHLLEQLELHHAERCK